MITFDIYTGQLRINGALRGIGYSGHDPYSNDPDYFKEKGKGPIPPGQYHIRQWSKEEVDRGHKGPVVFQLSQLPGTEMFNRDGFLIHWDNIQQNFTGSDGCIVFWFSVVFAAISVAVKNGDATLSVISSKPKPDATNPTT